MIGERVSCAVLAFCRAAVSRKRDKWSNTAGGLAVNSVDVAGMTILLYILQYRKNVVLCFWILEMQKVGADGTYFEILVLRIENRNV